MGLLADGTYGPGWNGVGNALADPVGEGVTGLFYGDAGQFAAQLIGVATIVFVMGGIVYGFFTLQNKLTKGGIRPTAEEELEGLDLPEIGVVAYPEFTEAISLPSGNGDRADGERVPEPVASAPPV